MKKNYIYVLTMDGDYTPLVVCSLEEGLIKKGDNIHDNHLIAFALGYAKSKNCDFDVTYIETEEDLLKFKDILVEMNMFDEFKNNL